MMILKIKNIIYFLLPAVFIFSCLGQNSAVFTPSVDLSIYESKSFIDIENIIDSKNGASAQLLPPWLTAYIEGGAVTVEKLDLYNNKYVFVAVNEGLNFTVLDKWADNFAVTYDFPMLAASRIENRMIMSASKYPDDEYGLFFERMVKNAYSNEYHGTVKEDTSWIRIVKNENGESRNVYMFFILVSIDRNTLQNNIRSMMARTSAAVTVTSAQGHAINRLRQTFFEGF